MVRQEKGVLAPKLEVQLWQIQCLKLLYTVNVGLELANQY